MKNAKLFSRQSMIYLLAITVLLTLAACTTEAAPTTVEIPAPTVDVEALTNEIISTVVSEITQEAIAAEQTQSAEPTSVPTEMPTEAPTEEPEPTAEPTEEVLPTATSMPEPTATTAVVSNTSTTCVYVASFIADVNVPEGSSYDPDTSFTKTWQIKNNGSCSWDNDYKIVFTSGDQMNGPDVTSFNVGTVKPGQTVNLSVNLKSPSEDGTYTGYWMLRTDMGEYFGIGTSGQALKVSIVVE